MSGWYAVFDADNNLVSTGTVVAEKLPKGWHYEELESPPGSQVWDPDKRKFGPWKPDQAAAEARAAALNSAKALLANSNRSPAQTQQLLDALQALVPELAPKKVAAKRRAAKKPAKKAAQKKG